ncbi:MAG: type II secretion system protein [Planctomycetota bacterium]
MPRRYSVNIDRVKSPGFTLIEVLVVVGIITLLIAILIPSLARSRENARSVVCLNNLKEWGNVMNMYTYQNKGSLPFEERPDPRPGMGPGGETEDADGDHVWDNLPGEPRGWICWYDVLDRYFGGQQLDKGVKVCPTVRRGDLYCEESYRMNSKLADCAKYRPPGSKQRNKYYMPYRRLSTLKWPNKTALLFDGDMGPGKDQNSPPSFKGRWRLDSIRGVSDDVSYRHNRSTNMLFADWHIEKFLKKIMKDKSYENRGIIWQPPDMGPWDPAPK